MGNIVKTAQCRFCGQMVQIETDKELTQPQAEEQATMTCNCTEAVEYQKEKQRKEKAMMNVSALFGENAAPDKRCGEGIVNILKAAVEEIYTGGLAKVTLNLRGGGQSINFTECKGWKELIAGAIDNAYEKMIATTPPTTEEEQTHCEMIKEAVKGMFINESRTAAEAEFIKTHIVDYEKIFDVCMNGDDLEFKKGLVRLQKMQNEYVMQRENDL